MHYNDIPGLRKKGWHRPVNVWSNAAFFIAAAFPPRPSMTWQCTMWGLGFASWVFHATLEPWARVGDNVFCALFEIVCLGWCWKWPPAVVWLLWPFVYAAQVVVSKGFEVDAVLVFSNLFTLWWHEHYVPLVIVVVSFAFWYQNMLGARPLAWCHAVFHVGMALSGYLLWCTT